MDRDEVDRDSGDRDSGVPESGAPESRPGGADGAEAAEEEWERPIDKFRRTATGTVIAAGLLGLQDALEGRPEDRSERLSYPETRARIREAALWALPDSTPRARY